MNRKLEDFKLNNIKEEEPSSDKYDFLKKKEKGKELSRSTKRIPDTPRMRDRNRPFNKTILFFFVLSIAIGAFYLLSTEFLSAKITIIHKNQTFELSHDKFTGGKLSSGNIPFEVMIVSDNQSKDVVYTSSLDASEKAKGEITLYNEYSTKVQKITAGTFISDEKGKSYKIDKTVSIPGYTLDGVKAIIPGQISVGITAFLAGDTYNGSPATFSINSFKGTTKYKKIYGQTKIPLTGGMVGLVYILDEKEKTDILSNTTALKEKLLRKLSAQVPKGYILYPDIVNFSHEIVGENVVSKNPNTTIEIKSTVSAFLMKEDDLSEFLIQKLLPNISPKERSEILNPDLSLLSFNFVNKDQVVSKDIDSFDFELTGSLPLDWKPDVLELKDVLVGKKKVEIPDILKQDPGISSASIRIFPLWSKSLPENAKKINIILK
ncbi:MAG: hypothetical protein WCW54_00370 [Candidatus Paceibacterota bacterium]